MSRFFLNIRLNGSLEDLEGYEFATLAQARREAELAAREIVAEDLKAGYALGLSRSIIILDGERQQVAELLFSELIAA
jgi:hypothetical protein